MKNSLKTVFALAIVALTVVGCASESADAADEAPVPADEANVGHTSQAATTGWWCYNGTCCQSDGNSVSRTCSFDCSGMLDGYVSGWVKSIGCWN